MFLFENLGHKNHPVGETSSSRHTTETSIVKEAMMHYLGGMGLVALAIVTTVAADVAPLPAPLPAPAQPLTPKKRHLPALKNTPQFSGKIR